MNSYIHSYAYNKSFFPARYAKYNFSRLVSDKIYNYLPKPHYSRQLVYENTRLVLADKRSIHLSE